VTGFVGCALLAVREPEPTGFLQQSVEALLRRRRGGGWGYNAFSSPDSDTTAWALRFLEGTGFHGPEIEEARAFLLRHRLEDGGFTTYAPSTPLRVDGRRMDAGYAGWRQTHLCAAANVAPELGATLLGLLRQSQAPDGRWIAYWWQNDIYSTALAAEALAQDPSAAAQRERAVAWGRTQGAHGLPAFDRAWLARLLLQGEEEDRRAAAALVAALAAEQLADGSWTAGAGLLVPDPWLLDRETSPKTYLDQRRVFTTASVLMAIAAVDGAELGA
jgi:hypothetical protein